VPRESKRRHEAKIIPRFDNSIDIEGSSQNRAYLSRKIPADN
jgi:hypothetical protein